jgi:hypothetical protein
MPEDVRRHIRAGELVPVNLFSDGVYDIEVRVGTGPTPAGLTEEENRAVARTSAAYRFRSCGVLCVSGIEYVEVPPGRLVGVLEVPAGEYAATVFDLTGSTSPPATGAMPELVVVLNPAPAGDAAYSDDDDTFGEQPVPAAGHLAVRVRGAPNWREAGRLIADVMGQDIVAVRTYLKSQEPVYLGPLVRANAHERLDRFDRLLSCLAGMGAGTDIVLDGRPVTREELQQYVTNHL